MEEMEELEEMKEKEEGLEEKALIVPPRGTQLTDLVEEFLFHQRRRVAFQLKIISRSKNALKRMAIKEDQEIARVISEFEEALRGRKSFDKSYQRAERKLTEPGKWKGAAKMYFEFQAMIKRKKPFKKVIAHVKPVLIEEEKWCERTEGFYWEHRQAEEGIMEMIRKAVTDWPVWTNWLRYVNGIELLLAAELKGSFESALAPNETLGNHFQRPSQMRQFAGVGDIRKSRKIKDEQLHYKEELKSLLEGRIATSFLKQKDGEISKSGYRDIYLNYKERHIKKLLAVGFKIVPAAQLPQKDGKKYESPGIISEGHVHQRAVRAMMQKFVDHFWEECRKAEGLPAGPNESYAFKILGHPVNSYIPPIRDI